jgi:outer membrane protein
MPECLKPTNNGHFLKQIIFLKMQPMKNAVTLLLVMILVLPAGSSAQQPWSLEDCILHALENNIQIKQQSLGVDIARENLSQSRANRFPSLNGSASHNYNFGRTVDPLTNEFATETVRSNNFNLSSGLTLFSGFQITNIIRQNELELQASRYDVERMQNDIALLVASYYLQILFSKELLAIAENQLEITRQQVDRTSRLVEAGTLARGNLFTIEAMAATEELQVVNAQNNLQLAYLDLVQLLDLESTEDFSIVTPDITISPGEDHLYAPLNIYQTAVQSQPEVLSANIRVESAERGVDIARGARSPSLNLRGSYGSGYSTAIQEITGIFPGEPQEIGITESGELVYGPSFDIQTDTKPFADQLRDNESRSLGLFLTIPIFNNYQVRSSVNRSRIALENARLSNQLVRDQLFKTIQQAHADAQAALKRYTATEKNVTALEEAFRYTEQRFNVGMVNALEYNDARNRLAAAQSELTQSKYEYVFRLQILEFYMGNPIRL